MCQGEQIKHSTAKELGRSLASSIEDVIQTDHFVEYVRTNQSEIMHHSWCLTEVLKMYLMLYTLKLQRHNN